MRTGLTRKLILVLVCAVVLSACGPAWFTEPIGKIATSIAESSAAIDDNGFTIELDGVQVSGSGSVAPQGSVVHANLMESALPDTVEEFAQPVGTGVEITIGTDTQPDSPITVTFAPEQVAQWSNGIDPGADFLPVVFTSREDGPGVELADAQLLADGSVIVLMEHLSSVMPGVIHAPSFGSWFQQQVGVVMQVRSETPDCLSQDSAPGWTISGAPDQVIWTCANEDGSNLDVTLTNNSPFVWFVETNGTFTTSSPLQNRSIVGSAVLLLAYNLIDAGTWPIIPPDGEVTFRASSSQEEVVFDVRLNGGLSIANGILSVLADVLPFKKVEAIGKAQCFIDALAGLGELSDGLDGELAGTLLSCAGTVLGALGGAAISALTTIPGTTYTFLAVNDRVRNGTDAFAITLTKSETISGDAEWPTDRNDSAPGLWIWLGTKFSYPDWVACDDARDYCLVGFEGGPHWLVDVHELEILYYLEDWVDPWEALLYCGLTEEQARQVLGI